MGDLEGAAVHPNRIRRDGNGGVVEALPGAEVEALLVQRRGHRRARPRARRRCRDSAHSHPVNGSTLVDGVDVAARQQEDGDRTSVDERRDPTVGGEPLDATDRTQRVQAARPATGGRRPGRLRGSASVMVIVRLRDALAAELDVGHGRVGFVGVHEGHEAGEPLGVVERLGPLALVGRPRGGPCRPRARRRGRARRR